VIRSLECLSFIVVEMERGYNDNHKDSWHCQESLFDDYSTETLIEPIHPAL
jgi:hypothetical protein